MIGEAPITSYIFVGTGEKLIPEYQSAGRKYMGLKEECIDMIKLILDDLGRKFMSSLKFQKQRGFNPFIYKGS